MPLGDTLRNYIQGTIHKNIIMNIDDLQRKVLSTSLETVTFCVQINDEHKLVDTMGKLSPFVSINTYFHLFIKIGVLICCL